MDRETVDKIAHLARLDLTEAERQQFVRHLGDILNYVNMLEELDTADVEPFMHADAQRDVFRKDEPAPCLGAEAALQNAPQRKGDFFRVPRVVDGAALSP